MMLTNEKKHENDRNRSNPNAHRRVDSNRDGDSQRNRTDDDLFGADET